MRIFQNLKEFTTFSIKFDIFKYLIILINFYNVLVFYKYLINNILFNLLYYFI